MSQHYIGIKQVFAWPEPRGDRPGYHVVYDLGTKDEYHSWSPADKFEAAYLPMRGSDGTRVTQAMVDGFVRAADAVTVGGKMTVVNVELASGTLYAESSACVDPANYDEAVGKDICLKRAKDRVWHLLGFALQWARAGLR